MKSGFCVLFFFLCLGSMAFAADTAEIPWVHKVVFGILLHDRGPGSDKHESGVDPNWEMQFNPPGWKWWRWVGSPLPTLGATPNFNHGTSIFYGAINYEFNLSNDTVDAWTYNLTKHLFAAGGVAATLHNGPLHKDPSDCDNHSDCGFGYRVMPRFHLELGYNFKEDQAISFFFDHMSHKGFLGGENEGIQHLGLRYHYTFKTP